jgi:prepilin-type N-terminal cleavage/methylation domain-containing protein
MTTDASLQPVAIAAPAHEKKKRGFTLTEIAIVLGIIGLILGAIWVAAAAVYNNLRVSHANTAVLQTAQAVRALYSTSQTMGTAGDITSQVIAAGAIPSDLVTGTTAIGPWPGSVLYVLTAAASDTAFTVQITNVPKAACINLINAVSGTNRDPGLTAIGATTATAPISATVAAAALTLATTQVAAPTTANAVAACSATVNPVAFEFALKT